MSSFIGRPLKECIEYCRKNKIEFVIEFNSLTTNCDEKLLEDFVVKIEQVNQNSIKIIASKFKIEV